MGYITLICSNIDMKLRETKGLNNNISFLNNNGSYNLTQNMCIINCLNLLEQNEFKLICQSSNKLYTWYTLKYQNPPIVYGISCTSDDTDSIVRTAVSPHIRVPLHAATNSCCNYCDEVFAAEEIDYNSGICNGCADATS